jgi:arylsulfatase A-like enzyme
VRPVEAGLTAAILAAVLAASCAGPASDRPIPADRPVHLEEHIDQAKIVGSAPPEDLPSAVGWRFDRPRTDWSPIVPLRKAASPIRTEQLGDALRLVLDVRAREPRSDKDRYSGGIITGLPDWRRADWAYIVVSARARSEGGVPTLAGKLNERSDAGGSDLARFADSTEKIELVADGRVHTYLIRADWSPGEYSGYARWHDPWTRLALWAESDREAEVDLLSVSLIPKEAKYAASPVGVLTEARGIALRRTLFMHAPGSIEYRLRVPKAARLDFGLGVLSLDSPLTFRVKGASGRAAAETLFEERFADRTGWGQRSLDMSRFAGRTVTLVLEAESERRGTVALWAAPTLSGARGPSTSPPPNVVLYVIDGGSADHMSVYGYNRRTTPHLERLAAAGAVFERAVSNSSWTKISAPSFMTSLHSSVLGPSENASGRLPPQAVPMAEHMHRAGYQTAVFVSNPHAGSMTGLDRGVDVLREAGVEPNSRSSEELQADFWNWRRDYPGRPYWAHIQPTDVHLPWTQNAAFAGLFVDPAAQGTYMEWYKRIALAEGSFAERFATAGLDPVRFHSLARGLYDETMAHQDAEIGRFVERLKAEGEWDDTLFIVTADHGSYAAGLLPIDPMPTAWGPPNLASCVSHVPLIVSWPGKIRPGQRFDQRVSLIDLLPTVLELAGLPGADSAEGRSFAPLILGRGGWEERPVFLDEFLVRPDTGEVYGTIDVIDGRWGASLRIGSAPGDERARPDDRRPAPLLLYDLWNDPQCARSLHRGRPEMVRRYGELLAKTFEEHRALAKRFTRLPDLPLDPERIETLRTLGYIK